jgi:uncharacterized protein
MPLVNQYRPGSFCWAELATSNAPAAKKFYTELFGWTVLDSQPVSGMTYSLLHLDGKEIAALYQLSENQQIHKTPSSWLPYVSVENVDRIVDQARTMGGLVLAEPRDAHEAGRLAILQDPAGAKFAVWKANQNIGARLIDQVGTICWNELSTSDALLAGTFYSNLFGWGRQIQQMDKLEYTILVNEDEPAGGMYEIFPARESIPSHWLVYFAVEDCESSVDHATRMGARILTPPKEITEVGQFCVMNDPQGATFAVIRLFNL